MKPELGDGLRLRRLDGPECWRILFGSAKARLADYSAEPKVRFHIRAKNHNTGSVRVSSRIMEPQRTLNVINHMLLMVERYGVRLQKYLSLFQREYQGVGLWGSVLSARAGEQRYRQRFMP